MPQALRHHACSGRRACLSRHHRQRNCYRLSPSSPSRPAPSERRRPCHRPPSTIRGRRSSAASAVVAAALRVNSRGRFPSVGRVRITAQPTPSSTTHPAYAASRASFTTARRRTAATPASTSHATAGPIVGRHDGVVSPHFPACFPASSSTGRCSAASMWWRHAMRGTHALAAGVGRKRRPPWSAPHRLSTRPRSVS